MSEFRSTISLGIHPAARKHGISDADIEHAVTQAMSIDDRENETRLYLGPARNAEMLEVATVIEGGSEIVVHAMKMRPKFQRLLLLPGE